MSFIIHKMNSFHIHGSRDDKDQLMALNFKVPQSLEKKILYDAQLK